MRISLDSNKFIVSRARYFETMKQKRDSDAQIYFHDESWINLGDVRKIFGYMKEKDAFAKMMAKVGLVTFNGGSLH